MTGRALITGVCGLIGSHLAEHLLAEGWTVDGVDRCADTTNIAAIRDRVQLVTAPLDATALAAFPGGRPYDAIFHLAGRLGPAEVVADPLSLLREHAEHTAAVCELAARTGAVVVLASSSEVYQWNTRDPMREDEPLVIGPSHLPRCAYAISKLQMEHVGLAYCRQQGVRVVVARLFNSVGPRQRPAFVLPIFARQALRGEPLTVHGDGTQTRTFTHVRDTVRALARLAACPSAYGEVVNVGAGEPCVSIGRAAEQVAAHVMATYAVHHAPSVRYVPFEATGDLAWRGMAVRRPDVAKLQRLTGLRLPDRWDEIVSDVCADWSARLGVRRRSAVRQVSPWDQPQRS